jgi:hypothetical protein
MKRDLIKISILKDGDKYGYMEYQTGNDPLVFNDVYGSGGFYDVEDIYASIIKNYEGMQIEVHINI